MIFQGAIKASAMAVTGRQLITTSNLKTTDETKLGLRLGKVAECAEIISKKSKWQQHQRGIIK